MNTFDLYLQSTSQYEHLPDVISFVAEDASGSFGLMAGHARFMTALTFGMARFCSNNDIWEYLALPGALVYFDSNRLYINTRRYIRSSDYTALGIEIEQQLRKEEETLKSLKHSLHKMDEAMLRRMWEIRRLSGASL